MHKCRRGLVASFIIQTAPAFLPKSSTWIETSCQNQLPPTKHTECRLHSCPLGHLKCGFKFIPLWLGFFPVHAGMSHRGEAGEKMAFFFVSELVFA